ILHLIDAAGVDGRDPVDDYHKIKTELRLFSGELADLPQIVVANKTDLPAAEENLARLAELAEADGHEFFTISAATNQGTKQLMQHVDKKIQELKLDDPPVEVVEQLVLPKKEIEPVDQFEVILTEEE